MHEPVMVPGLVLGMVSGAGRTPGPLGSILWRLTGKSVKVERFGLAPTVARPIGIAGHRPHEFMLN